MTVRSNALEPWEAWRSFRAIADALVATDTLDAAVADALVSELDDALAVRGIIPPGAFSAAPWPDLEVLRRPCPTPPAGAARAWLEAEIDRNLDLFASFTADAQPWAARDLLRIVGGPVRAFESVGLLASKDGPALLDEVVASLVAAGVDCGRAAPAGTEPRAEWVDFLRARPAPLPEPFEPDEARRPDRTLGTLAGTTNRLVAVAWSADAVRLELTVRPPSGEVTGGGTTAPLHARAVDDAGRLHLGQPVTARRPSGTVHVFLRPGFGPDVRGFDLRLTKGGERLDGSVAL